MKVLTKAILVTVVSSLLISLVAWGFGLESRVTKTEYELKSVKEVVIEVKGDTSSILCKMGEQSECDKIN